MITWVLSKQDHNSQLETSVQGDREGGEAADVLPSNDKDIEASLLLMTDIKTVKALLSSVSILFVFASSWVLRGGVLLPMAP